MFNTNFLYLTLDAHLFDGGAAAGGAAGGASAAGAGSQAAAGTPGTPANSRAGMKSGGLSNVVYGVQPEDGGNPAPEGNPQHSDNKPMDPKEMDKRYREMIKGDYKDSHTREVNRIIGERFKEYKGDRETLTAQQPIMDLLADRYGVSDPAQLLQQLNDDNNMWLDAASDAGMTVEQYKQFQRMQRENAALRQQQAARRGREAADRQVDAWHQEAEALKEKFPDFDLDTEAQNPEFLKLLQAHIPVEHAYRTIHMEEIMAAETAAAERRVTENVRARGQRPNEGGGRSSTPVTVKNDVSALTREDRAEIARRAARGANITFNR